MSSRYIRSPRRSIKRKPAVASLPIIVMAVLMMLIFVNYGLRLNALNYNYESIENALVAALFSGAVYNPELLADTGNIIILDHGKDIAQAQGVLPDITFDNSYKIFRECLKTNMKLSDDFTSPDSSITSSISIDEYRVYNYIADDNGYHVIEMGINDSGSCYVVRHPDNIPVYVQANEQSIEIVETSVYGKISFNMQPSGGSVFGTTAQNGRYTLARLVAAKERR